MKAITIVLLTGIFSNMCFADEFEIILEEDIKDCAFEKETIWCASFSGILEYDTRTKEKRYYTISDGLIDNICHCVAVDTEGVKWIGTSDGISSFDGENWSSFSREEHYLLGNNESIAIDQNENIWFVSHQGVCKKYEQGWTFWGGSWEGFTDVFIDNNNNIWFAGYGIGARVEGNDIIELYNDEKENYEFDYHWVAVDTNNVQFWGDSHGLKIVDGEEAIIHEDVNATAFALDADNIMWIGGYPELWKYENDQLSIAVDFKKFGFIGSVDDLEIDAEGAVWIASMSGLAKYTPDRPTSVQSTQPQILSIIKTYPNPFNAQTTLSFELPSDSVTKLAVYDCMGRKVRELVNGGMRAGRHSVLWDGRDDSGVSVGSGVYFSRLNSGESVANGRMVFVK